MNTSFAYTILQYRPSLLTTEAINAGLIFKFDGDHEMACVFRSARRIQKLYRDFNAAMYDNTIRTIERRIADDNRNLVCEGIYINDHFAPFLKKRLNWADSMLQFTESVVAATIADKQTTIGDYVNLLLPA